jgi:peptidoglycan hydrolase-like protein with peptidoglycan-binding domain
MPPLLTFCPPQVKDYHPALASRADPRHNPVMANLKRGSTGPDVAQLQAALGSRGFVVAVDGIFGPETEQAVRDFQASVGLAVDGIAGPATLGALKAPITQPVHAPKPRKWKRWALAAASLAVLRLLS